MNLKKASLAFVAGVVLSNVLTTIYYIITDEPNFVPIRREETVFIGLILTFRDTAGQERFRSVTSSYYRGSQVVWGSVIVIFYYSLFIYFLFLSL